MPRRRKPAREFRRDPKPLTIPQVWELILGPSEPSEFSDDQARRTAYLRHQERIDAYASGCSWARVVYTLGGFLPEDDGSINRVLGRLGLPLYPPVSWPPLREKAIVENFERRSIP